jgi:Ser/Thr protein kinase RdoA (MazF antagonist)
MQWPADHPAVTDPALARWAGDADRLCPEADAVEVLRYLPGRRVTTLVRTEQGLAVLKLFATSRARGGHRRLIALAASPAAPFVPRPLGHRKGHVALVEFIPGTPMDRIEGGGFTEASRAAGWTLRRIHDSGAKLDREWDVGAEVDQLRRTAGVATAPVVERAISRWLPPEDGAPVPSHRDCHPAQAVVGAAGVRFIDLDDSAMAPRGLDVGNFVAHLRMDDVLGRRTGEDVGAAIEAFLTGYGFEPSGTWAWASLSLARLAALAESRHGSAEQARRLAEELEGPWPTATAHRRPA